MDIIMNNMADEDCVDSCVLTLSNKEDIQLDSDPDKPESSLVLVGVDDLKSAQDETDVLKVSYDNFVTSAAHPSVTEWVANIYVSLILIISEKLVDNSKFLSHLALAIKQIKLARHSGKLKDEEEDGIVLVLIGHSKVPESSPLSDLPSTDAPDGVTVGVQKTLRDRHERRIMSIVKGCFSDESSYFFNAEIIVELKDASNPTKQSKYPADAVATPDDKIMHYLQEQLEDHTTFVRQHFIQLYGLSNVTIKSITHLNGPIYGCFGLEFRPTKLEKLQPLVTAFENGNIAKIICEELKRMPGNLLRGKRIKASVDRNQINKLYIRDEEVKRMAAGATNQSVRSVRLQTDGTNSQGIVVTHNISRGSPPRETTKKKAIVLGILERIISNTKSTPDELFKVLRSHPDAVTEAINGKGHGLLHMLIQAQRGDLMSAVIYGNLWGVLRGSVIALPEGSTDNPVHCGYTPRRLAEAVSIKGRGYKILLEYEKHEKIILNMTTLSKLCLQGNLPLIREYVRINSPALHQSDDTGHTALLTACAAGQTDIVKCLLSRGALTEVLTREKAGCLHLACKFGHTELLAVLLDDRDWDVSLVDASGYAAIEYAAMNGDVESLKTWAKKYKLTARCLVLASQYNRDKAVDYLLEEYQMDTNLGSDEENRTALCYAVINNDAKLLKKLLDHKADIQVRDVYGKNVFHLISHHNSERVLSTLLEAAKERGCWDQMVNAADIFVGQELLQIIRGKDKRRRAWHWVELHRHLLHSFRERMASGQIDVANFGEIRTCGFGFSPDEDSKKKMDELKEERLNKSQAQPDMTPLLVAVIRENVNIVEVLLDNGADPNKIDHFGLSPAHLAAMRGKLEILKMLEKAGGNLELVSKQQHTPEFLAQENGHMTIVNYLQAETTLQIAKNFVAKINETKEKMDDSVLMTERSKGHDIRRYLINTLRDLSIDINTVLLDLNSGPVMEESVTNHKNDSSELV